MAGDTAGKGTHLGGKIKEKAGELLGDRKMAREGRLDQVKGTAEQDEARAVEQAQDARARRAAAELAKDDPEVI
jgi:uncharacterized protein YjbJ (UPF0337 family)